MNTWPVGPAGVFFLVFFGVMIPVLAYRARDRLTSMRPWPSRRRVYASTVVQLTLFLVLAVLTAREEGVAAWRWPERFALPAAATVVLLGVMVMASRPLKRAAVARREPRVYFTMPAGAAEKTLWIALSVMAGVAEETVYRGVFTELATRLTGSLALAWALAVLAFSVAHANQGARAMAVIATFALVAHVLVLLTGTLLFAVALHAAYDAFAGFEYTRLGRELGYPTQGLPDAALESAVTTPPTSSSLERSRADAG